MDSATLIKYLNNHMPIARARTRELAYFSGVHPAIYAKSPREDPDNRVPVPIPRKAVSFITGYMAKPGNITYEGDYYETLKPIYDRCEESLLDAELLKTACIHGTAYELHWMDGVNQYFCKVPTEQGIMIYSDALGIFAEPEYFIRHWRDMEGREYAEVWDKKDRTKYEVTILNVKELESMPHGYNAVPVIEFNISDDKSNLFNHVLPLVDILDKGVSKDLANELERFAESYLLLAHRIDGTTVDENGESEVDKIARTRIFDGLQESVRDKVAFLEKNINPQFINTALDRIERLIYELMSVPNPSDDTFAAQSGIALAYKLIPLEYLSAQIEAYFTRGLQQRIRLMANGDRVLTGNSDVNEVTVKWTRNLPFNLVELADIAIKLKGILSDETILRLFPSNIITNVEKELERLESDTIDIETVEPTQETTQDTTQEVNGNES